MTQLVVVAEPQTSRHFESDDPILETRLILARPNAVLIERQFMIEPGVDLTGGQRQDQQQACGE